MRKAIVFLFAILCIMLLLGSFVADAKRSGGSKGLAKSSSTSFGSSSKTTAAALDGGITGAAAVQNTKHKGIDIDLDDDDDDDDIFELGDELLGLEEGDEAEEEGDEAEDEANETEEGAEEDEEEGESEESEDSPLGMLPLVFALALVLIVISHRRS